MKHLLAGILITLFFVFPLRVAADVADLENPDIFYTEFYLINEVMANPAGKDAEGEWVELYNTEPLAVDISYWYLDDAEGASKPYRFPGNTVIPKDGYLLVRAPDMNLSFKNSDDEVRLLAPNKQVVQAVRYDGAKEDFSYAKMNDGWHWVSRVTPGDDNQPAAWGKFYAPDDVEIVSAFPNPDGSDDGLEQLRLRNNLEEAVDLSYWRLLNKKDKVYGLSGEIEALKTIVVNPADFGLTLINSHDHIKLVDGAGNLIDEMEWEEAPSGQTLFNDDFLYDEIEAAVTEVIDGDTFRAVIEDLPVTVRLIGVDTPETVHPFKEVEEYGYTASDYLKNRLEGQVVTLSFESNQTDTYNRLLAYVYLDDVFINAELVQQGIGTAYTRFDFAYKDDFIDLEQEAKLEGLGLWFDGTAEITDYPEDTIEVSEPAFGPVLDPEARTRREGSGPEREEEPQLIAVTEEEVITCATEGLVIESILPNDEKGFSQEYIRVTNPTNGKICLSGWQLDDAVGKGSKPFNIKGGSLVPGSIRTFRKSETGLALNNSNDCANLINPLGEVVDHVCYAKTHKNEIFTHAGGNWEPTPKKSDDVRPQPTAKQVRLSRSPTHFQSELADRRVSGIVDYVNDALHMMVINDTLIYYDDDRFDLAPYRGKPVTLQMRGGYLVSMVVDEALGQSERLAIWPVEFNYFVGLGLSITGLLGWRKRLLGGQRNSRE